MITSALESGFITVLLCYVLFLISSMFGRWMSSNVTMVSGGELLAFDDGSVL